MEKIRDKELVTKENIEPLMKESFEELLSEYKQGLLEALDKFEKKMETLSSPGLMEIYRRALNDVRQLIKGEINSGKKDKKK